MRDDELAQIMIVGINIVIGVLVILYLLTSFGSG